MSWVLRAALGALVVVAIGLLARTRNYFIAGLVPLFPTFALIAHFIVGSERSRTDLKTTIRFGMWSLLPYLAYLVAAYVLVDRLRLASALGAAAIVWLLAATLLVVVWRGG